METPYTVSSAAFSALGFVLGFVMGGVARTFLTTKLEGKRWWAHMRKNLLGVLVLMLTLAMAGQLAWFSYEQRQSTECQARHNQQFINAIRVRSALADQDRNNLANLVQAITTATNSVESRAALQKYLDTKARIDGEREQARWPALPEKAHC